MSNDDDPQIPQIPQILRDITPAQCRELVETLMGAPLQHQTSGTRRRVVENPTEKQRQQEHTVELAGGKIALPQRREKLLFETDWLPLDGVSESARSIAQVTYLGAMSSSRFQMSNGTEVLCADKWAEMVGPQRGEPANPWPEKPKEALEVSIGSVSISFRSVCEGIVERTERANELGENELPCPNCGVPCLADAVRCPHCGFGQDPEPEAY